MEIAKNITASLFICILGFTMAKAEEWVKPASEKTLVHQENEKYYLHHKKH